MWPSRCACLCVLELSPSGNVTAIWLVVIACSTQISEGLIMPVASYSCRHLLLSSFDSGSYSGWPSTHTVHPQLYMQTHTHTHTYTHVVKFNPVTVWGSVDTGYGWERSHPITATPGACIHTHAGKSTVRTTHWNTHTLHNDSCGQTSTLIHSIGIYSHLTLPFREKKDNTLSRGLVKRSQSLADSTVSTACIHLQDVSVQV